MKIFLAGSEARQNRQSLIQCGAKNVLMSFHYFTKGKNTLAKFVSEFVNGAPDVFVDSGGFTARKYGTPISVTDYATFLNTNADDIFVAANLDTNDEEETDRNLLYLRKQTKGENFNVIPVYHPTEYLGTRQQREMLDRWCKEHEYIAIGGVAGANLDRAVLEKYLNYVFSRTGDTVRVHGFGITDLTLLQQYPFYSVDSTTWLNGGRFGEFQYFDGGTIKKYASARVLSQRAKPTMTHHGIMHGYHDKLCANVRAFMEFELWVSRLWEKRGVKWTNPKSSRSPTSASTSSLTSTDLSKRRGTTKPTTKNSRSSSPRT